MRRASTQELVHAVKVIATVVGTARGVYCLGGRIAIPLAEGWSLAVSPDFAERLKIEACLEGRVVATMWAFAGDDARLAELASDASAESAALAA